MNYDHCLRCGKKLTNPLSRERGFGRTCFSIKQLEGKNKVNEEVLREINFLKCEIKMLKQLYHQIKRNGNISQVEVIERITRDNTSKFRDPLLKEYRNAFKECISELKEVLKERANRIEQSIDRLPVIIERDFKLAKV
ncbi:MAG: DUF6011 domain-containing protein [Promethearchaeota archaeon]|jgi:hypothetical protein